MKKNKGFTLVELLVVIVILGIITGLSIPLIRNLSGTMEKKKYTTYNETLLSGAKLYNDSYGEDLFGHNENGCAYVTYSQLEDRNLLKDIEISDVSCNSDSTFVRILKIGDKYAYSPFLGCGKKKDGKANSIDTTLPIANQENVMKPEYCTGTEENNLEISAIIGSDANSMNKKRKKTKVVITSATGINTKMALSVKWSTNKNDHDGTFEKVDFKVPGDQKEKMLNGEIISTKSGELLTPAGETGEYYLIVKVDLLQDLYGSKWKNPDGTSSKYVSFGPFVIDNEPPTVPVITAYVKTSATNITSEGTLSTIKTDNWSSKWIFTKPSSTDNSGKTITYYYTTTGKTTNNTNTKGSYKNINEEGKSNIKYKACDVAGNCSEYSANFIIKLDRTKPTCGTASGASTTWTKDDRTIKQACSDKLDNDATQASGCEKTSYDTTYNTTTKTSSVTIKDKVGNENTCSYNVYVDKTKPTCGTATNASTTWTNQNRTIKQACTDSHSGCEKTSYDKTYNSTTKTDKITIKDKVGNENTCNYNVYVDKTKPTCGTVTGDSTTWTNQNRTIKQACTDSHSGCEKTSYDKTYNSTMKTETITIKDKAKNENTCTYNVYVDKNSPTCTTNKTKTKDKDGVDGTINCSDTGGSGCDSSNNNTFSNKKKNTTFTVKDVAGNTGTCTVKVTSYSENRYRTAKSCSFKYQATCTTTKNLFVPAETSCSGSSITWGGYTWTANGRGNGCSKSDNNTDGPCCSFKRYYSCTKTGTHTSGSDCGWNDWSTSSCTVSSDKCEKKSVTLYK